MSSVRELEAAGTALLEPSPAYVERVQRETSDTVTLDVRVAGNAVRPFAPGQFDMVTAIGIGEAPISLSGAAGDGCERQYTVRDVGAVTRALSSLQPGQALGVRGPYGWPWPVEAAEGADVVVVAGGLGLAPLRPAILHMLANRERYQSLGILYGARSPADLLFLDELQQWRGRLDVDVAVTVDAPTPPHAPGPPWHGHVGVVTSLIAEFKFEPAAVTAFVCGPEVMMRFTMKELGRQGVAHHQVFVSMERSMACGVGLCGHCQLGPLFVCTDGPVLRQDRVARWLTVPEL